MMRLFLIYFTLFFTTVGYSQSLTGIWRGYFVQSIFHLRSGQFVEERYKYELQLNNLPNDAVEGVTYSYKNTLFYGKAASQGIYTRKSKLLLLKESKMLELKISDQSVACLMTCYLDYSKSKTENKETLTGTYSSVNEKDGSICGNGTVYLEKVTNTEFEKEDFLLKKESPIVKHKNNTIAKKAIPSIKPEAVQALIKPGAEDFMINKNIVKPLVKKEIIDTQKVDIHSSIQQNENTRDFKSKPQTNDSVQNPKEIKKKDSRENSTTITPKTTNIPVPEVLVKRRNVIASTFIVDSQDVSIEFYDNGQIDGDTISVYHDNKMIVSSQRLTYSPIRMNIHIQKDLPVYEFIVVAENLGEVPPNTALVIISSGSKHYEINIASDEDRNAKIVLQYQKPPEKE